jgi:hypothetical protein
MWTTTHSQTTIPIQIQDYYVVMKLNERQTSIMALYRLFLVSYMLRNVKIDGMGTPHDYPKMMMCQLLSMSYWSSFDLPAWRMMQNNMCVFNEEMGETYYSVLSRCVLGDNIKSDFEHMNKIFKLLPLYKQVKDDMSSDVRDKMFSLTWHHNVDLDAEEITATSFFFKRLIKNIVDGSYRSYEYSTTYSTIGGCIDTLTRNYVPLVYKTDVSKDVEELAVKIRKAISTNFLEPHAKDWPFQPSSESEYDENKSNGNISDTESDHPNDSMSGDDDNNYSQHSQQHWGPSWAECVVGRFAVLRCAIGENETPGICVVKVTRKDVEILSGLYPERTLQGLEYLCTKSNIQPNCVRGGKWNFHKTKSTADEYDNSNVIKYFDKLIDGALPVTVMRAVEKSHANLAVFEQS